MRQAGLAEFVALRFPAWDQCYKTFYARNLQISRSVCWLLAFPA